MCVVGLGAEEPLLLERPFPCNSLHIYTKIVADHKILKTDMQERFYSFWVRAISFTPRTMRISRPSWGIQLSAPDIPGLTPPSCSPTVASHNGILLSFLLLLS